jgi:hypothetical protein
MFRSEQGVIPGSEPQNYDDIRRKLKDFSQCKGFPSSLSRPPSGTFMKKINIKDDLFKQVQYNKKTMQELRTMREQHAARHSSRIWPGCETSRRISTNTDRSCSASTTDSPRLRKSWRNG